MLITDSYGIPPGATTSRESYENEFRWGSGFQAIYGNALIDGNSTDAGNTPTTELRPGLLLGQVIATGKYKTYNPVGTDGTEVASGILLEGLNMLMNNVPTDRFYAVLVGGPVKAANILGLDLMARQQMDKFIFDDSVGIGSIPGNHWFPWKRFQSKTANYTILPSDNFTLFDSNAVAAEVDFTLPAIANGYFFGFRATAAQVVKAISAEGANVVGSTLTQTSASVTAIGGNFWVYSNPAGTKWLVEQHGTQTITFA